MILVDFKGNWYSQLYECRWSGCVLWTRMVIGRLGNSWGLVCLSFESGACVFLGQGCWLVGQRIVCLSSLDTDTGVSGWCRIWLTRLVCPSQPLALTCNSGCKKSLYVLFFSIAHTNPQTYIAYILCIYQICRLVSHWQRVHIAHLFLNTPRCQCLTSIVTEETCLPPLPPTCLVGRPTKPLGPNPCKDAHFTQCKHSEHKTTLSSPLCWPLGPNPDLSVDNTLIIHYSAHNSQVIWTNMLLPKEPLSITNRCLVNNDYLKCDSL